MTYFPRSLQSGRKLIQHFNHSRQARCYEYLLSRFCEDVQCAFENDPFSRESQGLNNFDWLEIKKVRQ